MRRTALAGALALLALLLLVPRPAQAARCTPAGQLTVSVTTSAALGNYNPFTTPTTRTAQIRVTNNTGVTCDLALTFQRATLPATMANGSSTLGYDITDGATSQMITTGPPTTGQAIDFTLVNGASTTISVYVTATASQVVASGSYADNGVTAEIWDRFPSTDRLRRSVAFPVTATVIAVCNLPAPSPSSLNFNTAIVGAVPDPAVVKTTSITNAQCTAPTKVRLSGNSLRTTPAGSPRTGFDTYIDWTATATFGSATATITTTGLSSTPAVTSSSKNSVSSPTSGTVSVSNIHLLAANPVLEGSYSGTLTIQIDPSF